MAFRYINSFGFLLGHRLSLPDHVTFESSLRADTQWHLEQMKYMIWFLQPSSMNELSAHLLTSTLCRSMLGHIGSFLEFGYIEIFGLRGRASLMNLSRMKSV